MRRKKCARKGMRCYSCKASDGKYGGTLVASQEKYILIIPKQNRSNSQTKPLYDTDKQMKHRSLQKREET